MIEGIKILLERMKTHPEEFVIDSYGGSSKWEKIVDRYRAVLTPQELGEFERGRREAMRQSFTAKILETLLEEKHVDDTLTYTSQGRVLFGNTAVPVSDSWNTTASLQLNEHIQKQMVEQIKAELVKQKQELIKEQHGNKTKMQQLLQNVTGKKKVY
jgi:hypothetical protein